VLCLGRGFRNETYEDFAELGRRSGEGRGHLREINHFVLGRRRVGRELGCHGASYV
jgi:hypothetical protein